jgi:predicted secreted protein
MGIVVKAAATLVVIEAVTIPSIIEVTVGGVGRETVDITTFESTSGWRQHVAGLKDGGTITIGMNYIPDNAAQHQIVAHSMDDDSLDTVVIAWPNAAGTTTAFTAECLFTGVEVTPGGVGGKLVATVTYKVSGAPTFA